MGFERFQPPDPHAGDAGGDQQQQRKSQAEARADFQIRITHGLCLL